NRLAAGAIRGARGVPHGPGGAGRRPIRPRRAGARLFGDDGVARGDHAHPARHARRARPRPEPGPAGPVSHRARSRRGARGGCGGGAGAGGATAGTAAPAAPPPPAAPRDTVAPSPPPPPPARRRPAAAAAGRLSVGATPWGEVYIDGQSAGHTPLIAAPVGAGWHQLRIVRDGFGPFERRV